MLQVLGRLPFDDSNHKALLKQVKKGPVFPENVSIALDCKALIKKILRRRERLSLTQIRNDGWYKRMLSRLPSDSLQKKPSKEASPKSEIPKETKNPPKTSSKQKLGAQEAAQTNSEPSKNQSTERDQKNSKDPGRKTPTGLQHHSSQKEKEKGNGSATDTRAIETKEMDRMLTKEAERTTERKSETNIRRPKSAS